jgi:hypothetical protein
MERGAKARWSGLATIDEAVVLELRYMVFEVGPSSNLQWLAGRRQSYIALRKLRASRGAYVGEPLQGKTCCAPLASDISFRWKIEARKPISNLLLVNWLGRVGVQRRQWRLDLKLCCLAGSP